jgi:hypothetical protein
MDYAENTILYCCSSVVAADVAQQRVYMPQYNDQVTDYEMDGAD